MIPILNEPSFYAPFQVFKFIGTNGGTLTNLSKQPLQICDVDVARLNAQLVNSNLPPTVDRDCIVLAINQILDGDGAARILYWAARRNLARGAEMEVSVTIPKAKPGRLDIYDNFGCYYIGSKDGKLYISSKPGEAPELAEPDEVSNKGSRPSKSWSPSPETPVEIDDLVFTGRDEGRVLEIKPKTPGEILGARSLFLYYTGPQFADSFQIPLPIPVTLYFTRAGCSNVLVKNSLI